MILIDATTMWQCETCYWHGNTGCSSFIWCENGESYRPSMDKLKKVEAEPVRHGHWVSKTDELGDEYTMCSNCMVEFKFKGTDGEMIYLDMKNTHYCPYCGAKNG